MNLSTESIEKLRGLYKAKCSKNFSDKEIYDLAGQTDKIIKNNKLNEHSKTDGLDLEKKVEEYFRQNGWKVDPNINYFYNAKDREIDMVATKPFWALEGVHREPENTPFNIKLIINIKGVVSPTSLYFEKKDFVEISKLFEEKLFFYKSLNKLYSEHIPKFHHYQYVEEIAYKEINTKSENKIFDDFKQCLDYERVARSKNSFKKYDIIFIVVIINPLNNIVREEGDRPLVNDNFQFVHRSEESKYSIADIVFFEKMNDFLKIIDEDIAQFKKYLDNIRLSSEFLNRSKIKTRGLFQRSPY